MGFVAVCDMVVAEEEMIFGWLKTEVGLFLMQVVNLLQRLTPDRLFREMCIIGEFSTSAKVHVFGLVSHFLPRKSLDTKIDWLLARGVDKSPTGVLFCRYALRVIADMTFDQSLSSRPCRSPALPQQKTCMTESRQLRNGAHPYGPIDE